MTSERTLTVAYLQELAASVLGSAPAKIGPDDDLGLLGMDSLRMMRVLTKLRAAGWSLRFSRMAQEPTIRAWQAATVPETAGSRPPRRTTDGAPAPHLHEPFELTPVQNAYRLGRDERLTLGGVGAQYYVELDGAGVNPARLRSAATGLMMRHAMLRAAFADDGTQRILAEPAWPGLRIFDDTACPSAELAQRLLGRRDELAHQQLRPHDGYVFDLALSLLPERRTRLHLTIDMLVADADSFRILLNDLAGCYLDAELPGLRYGFADYVDDRKAQGSEASDAARAFWSDRLPDLPRAPMLPTRPAGSRRINRRSWQMEAAATLELESWARDRALSLATVLMTAFAETVAAWSENKRFLLNIPFYLREHFHDDVPFVVGDFTNLLLLDCDMTGDLPFASRAAALQRQLREDADHLAYSGVHLLRDLTRAWGEPALAPIVFTSGLGIGDLYSHRVRETFGEPVWTVSRVPQTLLDCQVLEFDGGLLVNWDCVDDAFADGVLDTMFAGFVRLVTSRGDRVGLFGPCRAEVNATAGPVPAGLLHDGFFERAAAAPDDLAVVGDGIAVSYGELAQRARGVAGWLAGRGVLPGDRVGVSLVKSVDQLAAVLGVLAAGGVYVPLAVDQPAGRRRRMCQSAGVGVSIEAAVQGPAAPLRRVDPRAAAYVIFTSGSTGDPKGVVVSHRSAVNTVGDIADRFDVRAGVGVWAVSVLDFYLWVFYLLGVGGVGGVVVLPAEDDRRDGVALARLCDRFGVTVWNSVPALAELALAAGSGTLPRTLRLMLLSGDWVRPGLTSAVLRAVPGVRLVALGGATEAAIWSNFFEVVGEPPVGWPSVPYGRPLRNQCFRVVDDRGRDCPDWVAGELWIGGEGVALGYVGDPELTARKFVEHEGGRWYRTGDMGRYRPGGLLEILGRRDGQVKIRGFRIELGEVEAALRRCTGVQQAVAVAEPFLAAYVTGTGDEPAWREELAAMLPAHMIPRRITVLDVLPLTRNGKVDRAALTNRVPRTPASEPAGKPGTNHLEKLVAGIWAEVLELPQVGPEDNFFHLGGDSITATRVMNQLAGHGVADASLRALFTHPTVAEFAAQIAVGDTARAAITPDPAGAHRPFPLTEVQRAYLIGKQDAFVLGGIGSQSYWEFEADDLDPERLDRALAIVVGRHEMLRAVTLDDRSQVVLDAVPPYRVAVFHTLARMRAETGLDSASWPPFSLRLARSGRRVHLGVSLDHTVFDARSAVIFLIELGCAYQDPASLPAPPRLSFRDYVLNCVPSPIERAAADRFWQARIPELPDPPSLPLARDLAAVQSPKFTRREHLIPAAQWQAVADRARQHGCSAAGVVAAAFAEIVSVWSGGADLLLMATTFDRRPLHPDVDRIVGDFTALALLAHRGGQPSWAQTARGMQEQLWSALDHRAVSGLEVLRKLAVHRGVPFVPVPVVFTSALGVPDADSALAGPLGRYRRGLSQTPQTLLDCQVMEFEGGVLVNWDGVDEALPDGVLDAMFEAFAELLGWLVDGDWAGRWEPPAVELPRRLPVGARTAVPAHAGPAGSHIEQLITTMWADALGLPHIGRHQNFFTLGGDSITANATVAAIQRHTGVTVTLRQVYERGTAAGIGELVGAQLDGGVPMEEGVL